jgi:hypothetical protein
MPGFFIKSIRPLAVHLHGRELQLPSTAGTELFISEPGSLEIPKEITIVGVENPEVFRKIDQLAIHFQPYGPCLFVLRFMSKGLARWLSDISNPYLHFGDFDPSGLQIYVSEYKNRIGPARCRFFIPEGIEKLIQQYGSRQLYDRQLRHTQNLGAENHPEIKNLARIIHKYGKGLEQEILLEPG